MLGKQRRNRDNRTVCKNTPLDTYGVVLVMPDEGPLDGPRLSSKCLESPYDNRDRPTMRKNAKKIESALRKKCSLFASEAVGCRKFRQLATCGGCAKGAIRLDIYGYTVAKDRSAHLNRHDTPGDARLPRCSKTTALYSELSYGPIVVVRRQRGGGLDLTAHEYRQYIERIWDSESIHSSEERSTDGSDDGSDLDDFIVSDTEY